jgi:hypothetical protein
MKRTASAALVSAVLLWSMVALGQPAVIPRIGQAPQSSGETFRKLKGYFSDTASSQFRLVSADARTGTIVAQRSGIDDRSWSEYAYCKMGASHLMDSLDYGAVTVKVKVQKAGRGSSYVHVDADFEGRYGGLGSGETTQQCVSRGLLERNILVAAGASQPGG